MITNVNNNVLKTLSSWDLSMVLFSLM